VGDTTSFGGWRTDTWGMCWHGGFPEGVPAGRKVVAGNFKQTSPGIYSFGQNVIMWSRIMDYLKAAFMNTLRSKLIILSPRHKPFTQPLINNKNDLSSDLRTQKACLLHTDLFPFREIFRYLQELDARRSLSMTGMLM